MPFVCLPQLLEAKTNDKNTTKVKKVIVFSMIGMLYFEEFNKYTPPPFNGGITLKYGWGLNYFFATYFNISKLKYDH